MDIERISVRQARADISHDALLVNAYDTDEKFQNTYVGGALSLRELQAIENELPTNREIIFYCA